MRTAAEFVSGTLPSTSIDLWTIASAKDIRHMMLHEMHEDHGHVEIYMQKQNKTTTTKKKK